MSYNIHGKKLNEEIIEYLDNFDIIILSETHNVAERITELENNWIVKIEQAVKCNVKGRASGGMAVGVKRSKTNICKVEGAKSGIYVKICDENYIIPVYLNCNNWSKERDNLENKIQELDKENIMIIGDMNARIGEGQTTAVDGTIKTRRSRDKTTNANGRDLMDMLEIYDL